MWFQPLHIWHVVGARVHTLHLYPLVVELRSAPHLLAVGSSMSMRNHCRLGVSWRKDRRTPIHLGSFGWDLRRTSHAACAWDSSFYSTLRFGGTVICFGMDECASATPPNCLQCNVPVKAAMGTEGATGTRFFLTHGKAFQQR